MADKRSTADDAATAVPTTRAGEPDQAGPARKRTTKAAKASKAAAAAEPTGAAEAAEPVSADAPAKPAKRTKAAKAAKASKSAGSTASSAADAQPAKAAPKADKATKAATAAKATKAAKSTKSATPAEPAQQTGATEQPELEPTNQASKSTSRRPANRTASQASVPAPRTESTDAPVGPTDAPTETLPEPTDTPIEALAEPSPTAGEPSTTPAVPAEPVPSLATVDPRAGARRAAVGPATPGAWTAAAWASVQDPGQPPRQLVELVVAELGPRAAAWADWLRATYPDPPAHGLVRLAAHQAGQLGWPLAIVGASGPVAAAIVGVPATAWVRASVVLRIAAAYGHDPTDPRRVDELLILLRLAGDADPGPADAGPAGPAKLGRFTGVAGRLGLARLALSRLGLRRTRAAKAVRILTTVTGHQESIERLAHRAARHYRPKTASV